MRGNINLVNKILPYLNKYCSNNIYLEAGANNGLRYSNSLYLEENHNWNGILVEPNIKQYSECIVNRPLSETYNYALVSSTYTESTIKGSFGINSKDDGLVGGVRFDYWEKHGEMNHHEKHIIDVEVSTLSNIMNKSKYDTPSFISLDIEGYELEALKGIDFNKHKVDVFLVEILEWQIKEVFDNHVNFMDNVGYVLDKSFINKNDYLFVNKKKYKI